MSTSYVRYPNTGAGVTSLNAETGAITLVGGTGITITPAGQNITISSSDLAGFPLLAPNGTAAAPSYSFSGSTNSGMFFGSTRVEISNAGTLAAAFTSAGGIESNFVLFQTRGEARFQDSTTNLITMKASTASAAYTFVLPAVAPTDGQFLQYNNGLTETVWSSTLPSGSFPLLAPNGTAAAPSYSFSAAPHVGIYSDGTNIEFGVGSALIAEVAAIGFNLPTGLVRAGNGSGSTPSHSFYNHNDMGMYTDGTSLLFTIGGGGFTAYITTGIFYMNGSFQGTNGTAANPSLSFNGSPDTGFYTDGASRLFASTAGALALTIDTTKVATFAGLIIAPVGLVSAPSYSFTGQTNSGMFFGNSRVEIATAGSLAAAFTSSGIMESNGVLFQTRGEARFQDSTTHLITMKASSTSAAYTFVLPAVAPTNGQILQYDSGLGETAWITSSVSFPLLGSNGSASAPTYSFTNKTNSGMYTDATNLLFTSNGTLALTIDGSQNTTFAGTIATGAHAVTANSVAVGSSANTITALRTVASDTTLTFQTNGTTTAGSITTGQVWTIGASGSVADHVIRGEGLLLTNGTAANVFELLSFSSTGSLGLGAGTNLGNAIQIWATSHATTPDRMDFTLGGGVVGRINTSAGNWTIGLNTSSSSTVTGDLAVAGNLSVSTAGKGLQVKEGSNAKQGVSTMVAGTVVVSNTSVTANSRIFITVQSLGTVAVATPVAVTARTAGTSFTISSSSITDTSVVAWQIFEPA